MSRGIAVLDPLPMYQRGVIAALGEAGLLAEAPDDVVTWSLHEAHPVVFLTLKSGTDWQLMTELCQARSNPVIVAVLDEADVANSLRALSAGATTVIGRDVPADRLRQVFIEAVRGRSVLPADLVRTMARCGTPASNGPAAPTDQELNWLQELARGVTVAKLADQSGYAERTMYRLLQSLYRRIGVSGRIEALICAHRNGWLNVQP